MGKKTGKIVAVAFVVALALVYALVPVPGWMDEGLSLRCALTHHFWHANVFHLAANGFALLVFAWAFPKWYRLLPAAFVAASFSTIFATQPVIGLSNIIFAMSGLCAPKVKGYWKLHTTWIFIGVMIGMLLIPRFSAMTHIASFIAGFVFGGIGEAIRRTANDCRRAGS